MYMHMRRSLNDYGRYIGVCVCVCLWVYMLVACVLIKINGFYICNYYACLNACECFVIEANLFIS